MRTNAHIQAHRQAHTIVSLQPSSQVSARAIQQKLCLSASSLIVMVELIDLRSPFLHCLTKALHLTLSIMTFSCSAYRFPLVCLAMPLIVLLLFCTTAHSWWIHQVIVLQLDSPRAPFLVPSYI